MSEKVGFIGLGAIGRPMAVHVARSFDTRVWNRTVERARQFAEAHGVEVAEGPEALVSWADVVITCLPTSTDVRQVVEPIHTWRSGQLLIDATSGDPAESRSIAGQLLGGESEHAQRAMAIVRPYAGKVQHVGPVGAGHALKAINNALLAVHIQAAGEGLAALVKLGVKGDTALEVINASSGRSNVSENLIPERVLTRAWPRTFRLALLDKDVGVALKVLQENGVPHDAIGTAKAAFGRARRALGEEADHVELIKEIEKAAGVEIA